MGKPQDSGARFFDTTKGSIDQVVDALSIVRDHHRGNDAGRYLSLAITELEQARHWLDDAADAAASIDSMIPGGQYKD